MNVVAPNREREAAPAVTAVDDIHERASSLRCSDIHIEPQDEGFRVRFRIDGSLREVATYGPALGTSVVSRVKILAGMDIAERRQPQDGRYTIAAGGGSIDARVSSVPTRVGEKLVIRLFDRRTETPSLGELGMSQSVREAFEAATVRASGFIVVCGPTASGKTTTLYAALSSLNTPERNICTIEDPIEQTIRGVTQIQINPKAGSSFQSSLRALLRQDPDVLMIGEMRDTETATIAVSAALSGRLVFATLHSADAPRAIERLVELGVPRASLASTLTAILAQRLVRRICERCSESALRCTHCSGARYFGRVGLFELIAVGEDLRDAIAGGASAAVIREVAARTGYRSLADDGASKLRDGITSATEIARVNGWAVA
jgi:type IV pilus assembly protein PilB